MTAFIGRREFITLLGGAAIAWPLAARAQQPTMPVIGFLHSASPDRHTPYWPGSVRACKKPAMSRVRTWRSNIAGLRGNTIDCRHWWRDLINRQVAMIVATGGDPSALAAKAATATFR